MNIVAVIFLAIALLANVAGFVLLGMPKLVTGVPDPNMAATLGSDPVNFSMYGKGFTDIFAGLKDHFKSFFDFKTMMANCAATGTSLYFYILVAVVGVSVILILIHFILLLIHKKGRALGPGIMFLFLTFIAYVMLVIFLMPVAAGRDFLKFDSGTNAWVPATDPDDFINVIVASQSGYAANAQQNVKTMLLMPFFLVGGGFVLGFIGFIVSFVDASKKKKIKVAPIATTANGQPIQVVVQNVPGKDRVIVIPGSAAPQQKGPQMVQYITTYGDDKNGDDGYATEDDVRQTIRKELNNRKNGVTEEPEANEGQVPPASNYMTEDEARQAIRDALTQEAPKK